MDLQFLGDNFRSLVYVVFAFSREDHFLPISHLVLSLSFLLSVDCKCWMWLRLCFLRWILFLLPLNSVFFLLCSDFERLQSFKIFNEHVQWLWFTKANSCRMKHERTLMTLLIVTHVCERKSTTPNETNFGAFFLGILILQNGSWVSSS